MDKHTICLLNDSFPPIIDGVANAVVNYAENIEKHHGHAVVVTPAVPGADDSGFPFPVVRYPSIDTRRLVGYVAGYPFSPETALRVREEKVELLHTHCPIASAGERHSCPCAERERLRRGVGGEPRRGREPALARLRRRVHCDGEWRGRAARARERCGGRRCDSGL